MKTKRFEHAAERLRRLKATLEDKIGEELRRPRPDSLALQRLKRTKLRVNDTLAGLVARRAGASAGLRA